MPHLLVPNTGKYRGADRAMRTNDLFPDRKSHEKALECYFDYVNDTDLSPVAPTLDTLKKYKRLFEQYHANCEIIRCEDHPLPIQALNEYRFLGIDLVNDGESALENLDWNPARFRALLNENELCDTLAVAQKVRQILYEVDSVPLTPCWVYSYEPSGAAD